MKNCVFISYRRDDAEGYAGRLEESLERLLGKGSVFRDVLDIAPGDDFAATIRTRLSTAQTVLVLIGPRWAGGETAGQRRIDDANDFVRLEVAVALDSGKRVVPVLLGGTPMPAASALPDDLEALARRNAMNLGDAHWDDDVMRLVAATGLPAGAGRRKWALVGAAAVLLGGALFWLRPLIGADPTQQLLGSWQGSVRYDWGDRYDERFEFTRHAGDLGGTATFLGYPRAIRNLHIEGSNLHFETHSIESMGDSTKQLTHRYAAELQGSGAQQVLRFRLLISGGHSSYRPIDFDARRVAAGAPVTPRAPASAPQPR